MTSWLLLLSVLGAAAETADAPMSILRFSPSGPEEVGMKGDEKSREHVYYTSAQDDQVQAGVWEAAPYTTGPHKTQKRKYSEFMYLLEGSVTLVDAGGREETSVPETPFSCRAAPSSHGSRPRRCASIG